MTFLPRNTSRTPMDEHAARRLPVLGRAPELGGVDPWFNTPDGEPLRLAALRDRVVLLEFWTFACVNCQRTLPFLRRVHSQYQPDFTVIGVHTPEFRFERSVQNVERAVREQALEYPVGLDNDFVAWNAYGNRYWPTLYLIDGAGQIRYTQIGEGNHGRTETAIRALLAEALDPTAEPEAAENLPKEQPQQKGNRMSLNNPVLTGPGAGRTVTTPSGSSAELKLDGGEAGGDWAVVEWHLRAGDEPPIHTHTREDETIYVLDGAITAFVGDQRIEVEAGSYAALPKDVPHGLSVRGDEARLLVTLEPAGAEYLFVPRDEGDADPERFGVVFHEPAPAS